MYKNNRILISLSAIFFLYFALNLIILNYKGQLFYRQELLKMSVCLDYYNVLSGNGFSASSSIYPPIFFLISGFFCVLAGGFSYFTCVYTNFLYLALFLFFFYYLAEKITGDKNTALLSAYILFIFTPNISRASRFYSMEFALAAFICMSLYFLLSTAYFRKKQNSLLFGLCCGISMLVKWTAFIYILPPFFVYAWNSLKGSGADARNRKMVAGNIVLALCAGGLLFLSWAVGFLNIKKMYASYCRSIVDESYITGLGAYIAVSFKSLERYFLATFFFLHGKYLFLFLKNRHKSKKFLVAWLVIPLIFLAFGAGAVSKRKVLPVLPAMALMSAMGVAGIKNKELKKRAVNFFIWGGAVIFLVNASLSLNAWERGYKERIRSVRNMLSVMEGAAERKNKVKVVYLDSGLPMEFDIIVQLFEYFSVSGGLKIDFKKYPRLNNAVISENINREIKASDYIIIVDKNPLMLIRKMNEYELELLCRETGRAEFSGSMGEDAVICLLRNPKAVKGGMN